jgi:hypothetical protein
MSLTLDAQISAKIEAFTQELSTLVKQAALDTVRDALGGTPTVKRRGPGRPKGSGAKSKAASQRKVAGGRRSSADVDSLAAAVLSAVKDSPGQGVTDIATALGVTSKDLRLPIQKLLAEKKLKTTGQKRGTRYHAGGRGAAAAGQPAKRAAKKKPVARKRLATKKNVKRGKRAKRAKRAA